MRDMRTKVLILNLLFLLFWCSLVAANPKTYGLPANEFHVNFYNKTCPQFQAIVQTRVISWLHSDITLGASLIDLHFRDCFVRGCDASILLQQPGSERTAAANKNARGFEVIDDIKAELERQCPRVVSCADILVTAARDAIRQLKGPFYEVELGRKDGNVSLAQEAAALPVGNETIDHLIQFYQARGLNILDLVTLSGFHTIGQTTCDNVQFRLFNFSGTGRPDPSIDPLYLNYLQRKCQWPDAKVDFDATTPEVFDNAYYINLERHMGLLLTDQLLQLDVRTKPLVTAFSLSPELFYRQFGVSIANLGDTDILTGSDEGEVRKKCSAVNGN